MQLGVAVLVVLVASSASAAPEDQNPTPPVQPRSTPDFLFGRPHGSVGIRGGWLFARAGSQWYDFVTAPNQLTIDRSDFNAPGIAADLGITITPRLEAVAGVEFTRASVNSEYRQLVDNNRQPITQTTTLGQINIMGSLKLALTERGRQVSTFAWVPHRVVPYAGTGAGILWYQLRQSGDFVDVLAARMPIFTDVFQSTDWTPAAHVFGGVDIRLTRRLFATFDARYLWAVGEMGRQFTGFDKLDLAGLRTSAGVTLVF